MENEEAEEKRETEGNKPIGGRRPEKNGRMEQEDNERIKE